MKDLIDRAQALCVVRQAWAKGLNPARFIEAMPQGGWVSVKDRLPEADGPYIVMTLRSWEHMPFRVMIMDLVTERGQGRKSRKWKWGHKVSMWRVTHWMELPEPPGGGGHVTAKEFLRRAKDVDRRVDEALKARIGRYVG